MSDDAVPAALARLEAIQAELRRGLARLEAGQAELRGDIAILRGEAAAFRDQMLDLLTSIRDQLVTPKPGWVKLRMTFTKADIGEFVFHFHILEHEDNGMVGTIQVVAD